MNQNQKQRRMEKLRAKIVPPARVYLRNYSGNYRNGKFSKIPLIWENDLIKLCELYDAKIKFIKDKKQYGGGSCWGRTITIYTDDDGFIDTRSLIRTFTHELSHLIQRRICKQEYKNIILRERETERHAYYIYKEYFTHVIELHHSNFSYGKSKESRENILSD